ncbi:cyclic nucleotide-gated ion channel 1-like [Argentina anserina]|uniref:cyclic nucleotide-gated ion channel 1-like n=1 Tax=Argentina anserina TaxID=57926 RepID=UPI00217669A8|nr:cyclic nucleotide-gated ion channel 1-like [Potentilla anserina]
MINSVDSVSIDLRVLDLKAKEESGKHRGKRTSVGEKLNERRNRVKHWWNTFFFISCAFAVFNDPTFCYMNAIDNKNKCINEDLKLAINYIIARTITDIIYLIDFLISKCGCCCSCPCCCCCRDRKKRSIGSCFLCFPNLLSTLSRLFVCLPIAQILAGSLPQIKQDSTFRVFFFVTSIQYTLRIYYIYGSLERRPMIDTTRFERWLRPILGFVPFILASHLFGAFWYYLATQKQIDCWLSTPLNQTISNTSSILSIVGDVSCATNLTELGFNVSQWDELCPVKDADPKIFDFGIYLYALQSDVTSLSQHPLQRAFQSFWWALRNLSSFGSNLNSSMDTLEIFFCVLISISGMALFLVYLNARVQESQERSNKVLLKERTQLRKPDVDLWLSRNLSNDMEIVVTKKTKKYLKTLIMENIHKLEENSDLNVQSILNVLPVKDKQSIMSVLFLATLKKVPALHTIDERVLVAICQHLVPMTYIEDSYIVQEGKPLGKMLLFTQGSAVTYSHSGTSNGSNSSNNWLQSGDFYGDELINWAFKSPSYPNLPISIRNVIAQEKVEAFAIRANDLKSIFFKFWWFFSRDVNVSQLQQWEHLAASSIQATWRNRQARIRQAASYVQPTSWLRRRAKITNSTNRTHWNRFVVN